MARVSTSLCAVLLVMAATGCEAVRPAQVASDVEREAARDLVAQLAAIASQPNEPHDILLAASGRSILQLIAPEGTPLALPDGDTAGDGADECLIATRNTATYSQCRLAEHMIDGIWSAQLSRIHADLEDVFVMGPGVHGSVAVAASLTAGQDLAGTMDTSVMWSIGNGDYVLDAVLRIDGLTIDGDRCATGGTIAITGGLGDGPENTTTLWFGPGCQDVLITR